MTDLKAEEYAVAIDFKSYPFPKDTESIQVYLEGEGPHDPTFLSEHFEDGVLYWHGPLFEEDLKAIKTIQARFIRANETNRVKRFTLDDVELVIQKVSEIQEEVPV